jgi:hypothetical protein
VDRGGNAALVSTHELCPGFHFRELAQVVRSSRTLLLGLANGDHMKSLSDAAVACIHEPIVGAFRLNISTGLVLSQEAKWV